MPWNLFSIERIDEPDRSAADVLADDDGCPLREALPRVVGVLDVVDDVVDVRRVRDVDAVGPRALDQEADEHIAGRPGRCVGVIESSNDYQALAQVDELEHLERLERVANSIEKLGEQHNTADQQEMLRLLSGLMNYRFATDYPGRIWQSKKQLIHLDRALAEADERVVGLRRITDRTQLDLSKFRDRISGQSEKIDGLRVRVADLLNQQEQKINRLAIDAIQVQQEHVRKLMLNARFELARIYDKLAVAN